MQEPFAESFGDKFIHAYRVMSFQVVGKMRNLSNQNKLKPARTTVIHVVVIMLKAAKIKFES